MLFLHVPAETSDTAIEAGVEATIELIRSIVVSGKLKQMIEEQRQVAQLNAASTQEKVLVE